MTELMIRWNASHDRMRLCEIAVDEARRASKPGHQQLERALDAQRQAIEAHYAIMDELSAAEDAENRAEELAAVAAAIAIIRAA